MNSVELDTDVGVTVKTNLSVVPSPLSILSFVFSFTDEQNGTTVAVTYDLMRSASVTNR